MSAFGKGDWVSGKECLSTIQPNQSTNNRNSLASLNRRTYKTKLTERAGRADSRTGPQNNSQKNTKCSRELLPLSLSRSWSAESGGKEICWLNFGFTQPSFISATRGMSEPQMLAEGKLCLSSNPGTSRYHSH